MPLTHLHILGPNLQNNYLESRFSLATGKRLLQIGDGIRIIDLDEIEDAIKQYSIEYNDPNPINYSTYIYIHMHGGLYMEPLNINLIKHYVSLNPTGYRYTKTRDLFLVLSKWAHGSNVQIHLDSCYSGMAIQDLDVFADGTVALAFAAKYYASHSYKETKIIKNVNSDYSIIKNLLSSLVDNVTPTGVLGYKNNGAVHELEFSLPLTLATSTKIAEHHLSEMRKDLINFVYKHNLVPKYIDAKFMNIEAKIFSEKQLQHHAGRMILWRGNIIGNKHPLSSIARYATSMLFDLNQNYFYDHKFFKLITDKPDIIAKISQFDYPFYHFGNKVLIDLLLSQLNSANQVSHQQALSNKQELSMRAHAELSRTYNASALNGKTNTDHAIAIRKLMDINSRLANESDTINIKALTMIRNELTSKYNNNQLEVIYTEILRLTLIHSISSTDPVEIATFSSLMTKKIQQLLIITENFHIYRYKRLLLLATSQHNLQEQFDTELSKFPGIGRNILPLLNKILTSFNSLSILKINSLYHKAEKITLKRQMLNDILTKRSSSNDEIKAKIDNFLAAVLTEKNEFRKLFHYIDNVFFKATLQQLLQITAIKEAVINNFKAELTLIASEI